MVSNARRGAPSLADIMSHRTVAELLSGGKGEQRQVQKKTAGRNQNEKYKIISSPNWRVIGLIFSLVALEAAVITRDVVLNDKLVTQPTLSNGSCLSGGSGKKENRNEMS